MVNTDVLHHKEIIDATIERIVSEQGRIVATASPEEYIHVQLALQNLRCASAHLLVATGVSA